MRSIRLNETTLRDCRFFLRLDLRDGGAGEGVVKADGSIRGARENVCSW